MSQRGGGQETRIKDVPLHGGVRGHLLPEGVVIIKPREPTLALGLSDDQACICKLVSGVRVRRHGCHISQEAIAP